MRVPLYVDDEYCLLSFVILKEMYFYFVLVLLKIDIIIRDIFKYEDCYHGQFLTMMSHFYLLKTLIKVLRLSL
jgi:hypothetical protein